MSIILTFLSAVTRLACIGFVVIAALTIPEAWNLTTETTPMKEDNTVFVPIEICKPLSIFIENSNTTFAFLTLGDAADNCHTFKYFINASVASMIFAGVAILLFLVFDLMSRYCKGPISHSAVVGMSLFLAFILVQTAACSYAMYNECQYWETFYEEKFAELDGESDVDEVRTFANKFFFFLTSIVAIASAGLLVIDSVIAFCVGESPKRNNNKQDTEEYVAPPVNTNTVAGSNDIIDDEIANNDSPEQATTVADPKSWTSY